MSAFCCSDLQTAVVACAYAVRIGFALPPEDIARGLRTLNLQALDAHYGDKFAPLDERERDPDATGGAPDPDEVRGFAGPSPWDRPWWTLERDARAWLASHGTADLCRAVACLTYQCAEGDCESRAWFRTLSRLDATLCKMIGGTDGPAWTSSQVWAFDTLDAPRAGLRRAA